MRREDRVRGGQQRMAGWEWLHVVDVKPGKDLFLNIRVSPSAQLDRVEEVLVVTHISEKAPDTEDLGPIRASDILAQRLPTIPDKPATDANAQPGAAAAGTPTNRGTTKPVGAAAPGSTTANATRVITPGVTPNGTRTTPAGSPANRTTVGTGTTGTTTHPSGTATGASNTTAATPRKAPIAIPNNAANATADTGTGTATKPKLSPPPSAAWPRCRPLSPAPRPRNCANGWKTK